MQLVLPARLGGDVAPVIRAWAAWTADRVSLPRSLRRRLLSELDGKLREFPAALAAASRKPHNRYFQDLPDDVISDDARCQQALQRRHLAVTLHHDQPKDTGTLDPTANVAGKPAGQRLTRRFGTQQVHRPECTAPKPDVAVVTIRCRAG